MSTRTIPTEQMVKPSEAAAMLGVHDNTVRNWIKAGKVPYVQTPTGHYLLPWTLLLQALRGTYDVSVAVREDALSEEEAVERLKD
jgi:excisionase family DNA binding protein